MSPENAALFWWIVGLVGFLQVVNIAVSIWKNTRPDPSLEQRLNALMSTFEARLARYASQERVESLEHNVSTTMDIHIRTLSARLDGMHTSLKSSEATNQTLFRDIMRAIGNLESKQKNAGAK